MMLILRFLYTVEAYMVDFHYEIYIGLQQLSAATYVFDSRIAFSWANRVALGWHECFI